MGHDSTAALATVLGFAFVGAGIALVPIPEIGFLLQAIGLGGVIGTLVALRMHRRDPGVEAWVVTALWSMLGGAIGLFIVLFDAIL